MPLKSIGKFPKLFTQLKILNGGQYQHQLKISLKLIQNVLPIEELFTGSNYKSYKHKYYLAFMEKNNKAPIEIPVIIWHPLDINCIMFY